MATTLWITTSGTKECDNATKPSGLGQKAQGLLWVPDAWVPPFVVLSSDLLASFYEGCSRIRSAAIDECSERIRDLLGSRIRDRSTGLIVRSNGIDETLADRGTYASQPTSWNGLSGTLTTVLSLVRKKVDSLSGMELIVQAYVPPKVRGHLSNERRVAEEHRDARVLQENINTGEIKEGPLSFRRWRDPAPPNTGALSCPSVKDITAVLREPLAFAALASKRVHFEWVWDGATLFVVQADFAPDSLGGVTPGSKVRAAIVPTPPETLQVFRRPTTADADSSGKLRNHLRYERHGFWQPEFYVCNDPEIITQIAAKRLPRSLEQDLRLLTQAPLVIRTSGAGEPTRLLPRSPLLVSVESANAWLSGELSGYMNDKKLSPDSITLIAHHFVPALASAFSEAQPSGEEVIVQSLWGIPEGLYYYPHDVYAVHTRSPDGSKLSSEHHERFAIKRTKRWKSHFVAPDDTGEFVRHKLAVPWDWKETIQDKSTLAEIAAFTRRVAISEGHPINLMWFLGCKAPQGEIRAIPWYHEKLEDLPKSVSYRRNARDNVVVVSTEASLEELEAMSSADDSERIVIELSPADDFAIRDEEFARRVGEAARALNAVILLQGASLSHVYYVLVRTGAAVVATHLAETEPIRKVHDKLVRDRVPDAVAASGEIARVRHLTHEARLAALRIKLVEEAFEVRDADRSQLLEELADTHEVLESIAKAADISSGDITEARRRKVAKRGSFDEGVLLVETSTDSAKAPDLELLGISGESQIVGTEKASPLEDIRHGWVDVRGGGNFVQFVQGANVALTHPEWMIQAVQRLQLPQGTLLEAIDWVVEGQRKGARLHVRIKIRIGSSQLSLPLEFSADDS